MTIPVFFALRESAPKPPPMPRHPIEAIFQAERAQKQRKPSIVVEWSRAMKSEGAKMGPGQRCPLCDRPLGPLTWLPPYRVEIETWGTAFGDLMFRGGSTVLVSELFRRVFQESRLRGPTDFQEVEIARVIKHRRFLRNPPKYYKLTIPLDNVRIDQQRSEYVWTINEPPCPHCLWPNGSVSLKSYKRLVVDATTWAGDDIFRAHGCSRVNFIVTDRFKNVCEDNGIKNVEFEALENCSWEKPAWEP